MERLQTLTAKAGVADEDGWSTMLAGLTTIRMVGSICWSRITSSGRPKNNAYCAKAAWLQVVLPSRQLQGAEDQALPQQHDGTFTESAMRPGWGSRIQGDGRGAADFNNDGWPDIAIANDSWPEFLVPQQT